MEEKFNFIKMSLKEFGTYMAGLRVGRTISTVQEHHTFSPDYALFNGSNHFDLQKSMWNYHVHSNGWADIGQHFTIFPDGSILTGRNIEMTPAGIYGQNQNAICIENLGNFDKGKDQMTKEQKESIVNVTAILCNKFSIPIDTNKVVYHHWFRLDNGVRNNGAGNNKSCPGTNFFGGNKVADCEKYFIPLVKQASASQSAPSPASPEMYVAVTASALNVRTKPSGTAPKAADRQPVLSGAILRVYDEKNGWYKISSSKNHWVYSVYTVEVKQAIVIASSLNVRNGPGVSSLKVGSLPQEAEVFIYEEKDGWARISMANRWVSAAYLAI